ncbi:transposase [Aquimarina longa]|uniref:transposase n=1 Tax=Aquimarina longa TaxID=1080221 RepID=UPI00078266B7|nr:transposase [Aquimarina longa]
MIVFILVISCGLNIDQIVPDLSTLSRFRTAKADESFFKEINAQLEFYNIIVKTETILDTSVIGTPLKPNGKANHKVTKGREDLQQVEVNKDYADSIDKEVYRYSMIQR